jgi:hypothetical protein
MFGLGLRQGDVQGGAIELVAQVVLVTFGVSRHGRCLQETPGVESTRVVDA